MIATPRKKPGPKPPGDDRTAKVVVRCSVAWRDWLNAYAASQGVPTSDLIERIANGHARGNGYEPEPPKR